MRVLNCFLDNRFGGPHKRAADVAFGLKNYNIDTIFLYDEKTKGSIPLPLYKGYLVKSSQFIRKNTKIRSILKFFAFLFYNLCKISRIIKKEKIDIIHINGAVNILPAVAALICNKKIIWHLNDTAVPLVLKKMIMPVIDRCSCKIILAAKKVGEYYLGDKKKFWHKSIVIYAPVNTAFFNPDSVEKDKIALLEKELGLSRKDIIIGTIGNINFLKGYEYFIKAARLIKDLKKNVKFIIAGDILDSQKKYFFYLEKVIKKLKLEDEIFFMGFIKDTKSLFSLLDVFVLSSIKEACPITVLEALSMKVPVVVTAVGGVEEQVIHGKSGIVVPSKDVDSLSRGVLDILNKDWPEVAKIVNYGRRRAISLFDVNKIIDKYRVVYEGGCRER